MVNKDLLGHLQFFYSIPIFKARKSHGHVIFYKLYEETIFVCLGLLTKTSLVEHMAII